MNDGSGKDMEAGKGSGQVPPPESPKDGDRRKADLGPPEGAPERRKSNDRRINRASIEGRERYLDMVSRERALLLQRGVNRSTEQLLNAAGAPPEHESEDFERDNASGDQLRASLPVQCWLPVNIHLISLDSGVLRIAPLQDLTERQADTLISTARRSNFKVNSIEVELWDRSELTQTLRAVQDLSADRCEKTLSSWLSDLDNGLFLNQFQRDMFAEALQMRASDIHIVQDNAPDAPNWIKYRIDGDLVPVHLLPPDAMARLTTLIKRDGGMNFGDRSTPQDGRFSFTWQGRMVDVRVASGPQAQDGEKLTLRLLDRAGLKKFDELFRRYPQVAAHLSRMINPEIKGGGGLILLSGPTGSGKTTTLYAVIQEIDRRRRHVLTIEDPIEYELRYATQWQVAHGSGGGKSNDFAGLIRAALRHDPDFIVIGEMRDEETVETALRAAESGHTVISTIHADTAVQTLERLRSFMPVERVRASTFTLSQQIAAVLNQRLVKTLCHGCAHKAKASEAIDERGLKSLHLQGDEIIKRHNHSGCNLCNRTGILGRTLLLEALLVTGETEKRNKVYEAILGNVNDVVAVDGVSFFSRARNLRELVLEGLMDPSVALTQLYD